MGAVETCGACRYRRGVACHASPPGLLPNQVRTWPTIALEDWCGRWRATDEVEDAEWEVEKAEWEAKRRSAGRWWRFWA